MKDIRFDAHELPKAKFPDVMIKSSNNNIELANVPNPVSPNEDNTDESQSAHQSPASPLSNTTSEIDGDTENGVDPIDGILNYLTNKRLYDKKKWTSWPLKSKRGKEVALAAYLTKIVDAVRRFLNNDKGLEPQPDDWVFSACYCNNAVQCDGPERKPDIAIVRRDLSKKDDLEATWRDIRGIGELKSTFRQSREELIGDLAEYARLTFGNDEARRFVLCFTIRQAKMQFVNFDRSGSVVSHEFNVHKDPHSFLRVIVGLLLGNDYYLGLDPSFTCSGTTRWVTLNGKRYKIIKTLQLERVIRGRGTVALLVEREDGAMFVMKDQWVDRFRMSKEPDIIKHLSDKNVTGIAKIVEYQIIHFKVEGEVVKDSTEKDSTENDRNSGIAAEVRDHYRLLISPYGDKLKNFSSLKELVSIFKDYVRGTCRFASYPRKLVTSLIIVIIDLHKAGVVHRDISLSNLIIVGDKGVAPRKGYIIDFDYAIFTERLAETYAKAERTVSGKWQMAKVHPR